ncbi:ABC-three component system middle component 1 [Paenibacillus sp. OK003]|uniref:ABC-three component system middle component 1 n=1 Tax=Paenibacillus sp. OK003 TaxID=1884380 RepID=UPI0008C22189|nr:ABC-three component system middle component 1 [Paenibacillus sp. OK003]SEL31378.1 hypothetical protein SAMN05518856_109259 [Paenibacillus sp. OK003]
MNLTQIRSRLELNLFKNKDLEFPVQNHELLDMHLEAGLELWFTKDRICVLKIYTSNHQFLFNWREDQVIISHLLDELPFNYKNNLYFILFLDIDSKIMFTDIPLEINRVEKNSKVCRKYVLHCEEDLQRVPFLQQKQINLKREKDYELKFKNELLSNISLDPKILRIVEGYFEIGKLKKENKKVDNKDYILKFLKGDALA